MSLASLICPEMAACCVNDGEIISFWNFVCNISQSNLQETCIGVSSKDLQIKEKVAFVIPKVFSFFVDKECVIKKFILERMQSIVNSC